MKTLLAIFMFILFSGSLLLINQESNLETATVSDSKVINSNLGVDNSKEDTELARKRPGRCCMG